MNPEPRPSKDCGACSRFEEEGYGECYCHCHKVGNYFTGFHEHFNYVDNGITNDMIKESGRHHGTVWG